MALSGPLTTICGAASFGDRGSTVRSATTGEKTWHENDRNGVGELNDLKPSIEGEYTRSPHPGKMSGLGETEMGARSYDKEEWAMYVACSLEGDGGKWT
jgi:hypothetical protein